MIFDEHNLEELLRSLEAEIAKSMNEIRHAEDDLAKAQNRQKFILALIHHIKQRYGDII